MKPFNFSSFSGYVPFTDVWWRHLLQHTLGFYVARERFPYLGWGAPGFISDIYTYWHRARYGWAPRDTWNLDVYLSRVMGHSLKHLAQNTHGSPYMYPYKSSDEIPVHVDGHREHDTDFDKWQTDLNRWGDALIHPSVNDYVEKHGNDYDAWDKDEVERKAVRLIALRELIEWWDALWD